MKLIKKLSAVIVGLSIALFIGFFQATPAHAYDSCTIDGIRYYALNASEVEASDTWELPSVVNIPQKITWPYDEYDSNSGKTFYVKVISSFSSSNMTQVTLPTGITTIKEYAFNNCKYLKSINIPGTVTSIGRDAFSSCSSLNSISIPDSVSSLGEYAFSYCESLKSARISNKLKTIPDYVFSYCDRLSSVSNQGNATVIGENAFYQCKSLSNYAMPAGLSKIMDDAFRESGLTTLTLPNGTYAIGKRAFKECPVLKTVTVSGGRSSYGEEAFSYCPALSSVSMKGVLSLGDGYAFYQCPKLSSFTMTGTINLGSSTFYGCSNLGTATFNGGTTFAGNSIFGGWANDDPLGAPANITVKGNAVFGDSSLSSNSRIRSVKVDGNASLGKGSYSGNAPYLTSFIVTGKVTKMGDNFFYGCSSLKTVKLPGLSAVPSGAFENCASLKSISFPDAKSIGSSAFNASGLTSVVIPDSVRSIGSSAFSHCKNLVSIAMPNKIDLVPDSFARECRKLKSIDIPEGVTDVGSYAFATCANMQTVTLPSTIEKIGTGGFYQCKELKHLYMKCKCPPAYEYGSAREHIDGSFWQIPSTCILHVPKGANAFKTQWKENWELFTIKWDTKYDAAAPTIVTNPEGKTVKKNASCTLKAQAQGSGKISYQWYKNTKNKATGGSKISGATKATYKVPTKSKGTAYYYCVVTHKDAKATGKKSAVKTTKVAKVVVK